MESFQKEKVDMQSKIESLQREVDANATKISELTKTNQKMNTLLKNKTEECLQLKNKRLAEANNPIERLL